jgi:hypothetical protein
MTTNRTALLRPLGFPLRFASRLSLQRPSGLSLRLPLRFPLLVSLLLLGAAAPETPPAPAPAASKLPPTVALKQVAPEEAMPILGRQVVAPDGKEVARLVDVLVDTDGKPVAAVLDFGGFMGLGTRKIAVHWGALQFEPAEITHQITLILTPDEIKAAPEYKDPAKPAPVVVPAVAAPKPGPK